MIKTETKKYLLVFGAAIGLFVLNNILLGFIVPKLPGGSATGITSMLVITWLSLTLRKFGHIPVIYLIYGLIGLPSHLAVGDKMYLVAISLLVLSALIYDWVLYLKRYRIIAHIFAYPLFVILVNSSYQFLNFLNTGDWTFPDLKAFLLSFPFGYAGILLGYLLSRKFSNPESHD